MSSVTIEQVRAVLAGIQYDDAPIAVSGIAVDGAHVVFSIEVDPAMGGQMEPLRQQAQDAVENMAGVQTATAVLTAERKAPPPLTVKSKPAQPQVSHKISSRPVAPDVKHIIAVASGKGGVGKSTVSSNLAAALALRGLKTGLLDADIYGASQPRMTGVRQKPETNADGLIVPLDAHGLKVMSMGFFVDAEAPVIWRGPMVHSAIQQLLRDVAWGDLDVLVIDLPPGTGDAQLSLAQNVKLAGAVIVSTPQDVALSEAKKGLAMFAKVNVPILGLVENMSFHVCSNCGHEEHIFGHGGVKAEAEKTGMTFLGTVPLHIRVREAADAGTPIVIAEPGHVCAQAFVRVAEAVHAAIFRSSTVTV
jgi:ATP-binding protein involved in chromosome partitioning